MINKFVIAAALAASVMSCAAATGSRAHECLDPTVHPHNDGHGHPRDGSTDPCSRTYAESIIMHKKLLDDAKAALEKSGSKRDRVQVREIDQKLKRLEAKERASKQ